MQSEDLPNVENRVEIAKNKQIKVYYHLNKQKVYRPLRYQFEKILSLRWISDNLRDTHAAKNYQSPRRNLPIC